MLNPLQSLGHALRPHIGPLHQALPMLLSGPAQVASVTVAALTQPTADNKVVEIVASQQAPSLPADQWFP